MDLLVNPTALHPFFLALEKYVRTTAHFHLVDEETGQAISVLFIPADSTWPQEDIPQFRLSNESIGFSLQELMDMAPAYERHFNVPIDGHETLRCLTHSLKLMQTVGAAPSARARREVDGGELLSSDQAV